MEGQGKSLQMRGHLGWVLKDEAGFPVPVGLQGSVMFKAVPARGDVFCHCPCLELPVQGANKKKATF